MVTEHLAMAEKLVHGHDVLDDHEGPGSTSSHPDDLGAFVSADDLEEFLRTFEGGEGDEAVLQTQGTDDIGGEPTTTVH